MREVGLVGVRKAGGCEKGHGEGLREGTVA